MTKLPKEDYIQFIYDKLNLDTKKSKIYTFKVDGDKELGSVLKTYLSKQIDIQLAAHCCMVNEEPFIGITLIVTKK